MKIAFLRKKYTPYGGAELYLQRLATNLLAQGHEIHLYACRWQNQSHQVFFHRVPILPGSACLESLSFAFSVRRLVNREKYDIVFSFERTLCQDIYRAGEGCHREWLRRRHSIQPLRKRLFEPVSPLHRVLLFLEKGTFTNSRLIIANSNQVKDEIIRHYHIAGEKIRVIYNNVDLEGYSPENKPRFRKKIRETLHVDDHNLLILFVGSGFRRKGLGFLIKAMAIACKDNRIPLKLVIAGKDKINSYVHLVKREGIAEQIIFLGPSDQVAGLLAASDLFVLPTIYDPFSNACLEALASGLPVITTRANGASELIVDGENGYLIREATDVRALTSAMVKYAQNPQKEEMQRKARLSAESTVKNYDEVAIYNKIFQSLKNPGN